MQPFLLTGKTSRDAACRAIWQAPPCSYVEIKPQKRTDDQNRKLWAMLGDVSRAKPMGRRHIPEVWKALFMAACGHQVAFEVGLDGNPFPIGFRSSRLSKAEMMDLITFILQWGDEHGVIWSNEARDEQSGG
jgi:hypothetical protein